jgi:DeoD family purine-nucleoside phosphorylase
VKTPIHLHPTAPLAERVLLPGDPGRALLFAQSLLHAPKMFNHNRGLWGYSGIAVDGQLLTIQSTGMGGPSAAIVISELADLGAQRLLRVGTCGALDASLELGDLLVASQAIPADGASRALGASPTVLPDPELVARLQAVGGSACHTGTVVSTDLFYDGPEGQEQRWIDAGARAVEMETATLFALAAKRGLHAAALLLVSDVVQPSRMRIERDALRAAELRMGELGVGALVGLAASSLERSLDPAESVLDRS